MLNYICMDVYRLLRSRYVYIVFFVFCTFLMFVLIGIQNGGVSVTSIARKEIQLVGYSFQNILYVFTNTHVLLTITAIVLILFYNEERSSTFSKNIYAIQRNRWLVYTGKWLVCVVVYASFLSCILIVCTLFNFLTNVKIVEITSVDILIYCIEVTLLNSSILYFIVLIENLTQGFVGPSIVLFLLISGALDTWIEEFVPLIASYSISGALADLPIQFCATISLRVIVLALLSILLYNIGNVIITKKREQK